MIDVARRDHPGLRFEVGSMTDLRLADASVAGLLAFWSPIAYSRSKPGQGPSSGIVPLPRWRSTP